MSGVAYRVVEDGWFVPRGLVSQYDLVYDAACALVHESTLQRGKPPSQMISQAPSRLPPRLARATRKTISESLVFLGPYDFRHYGHWITEGLARFWYLLQCPEEYKVATVPESAAIDMLRRRAGIFSGWRVAFDAFQTRKVALRSSVRVERIVVPDCSMRNRAYIRPAHLDVTRKIAATLLGDERPVPSDVPVYLSRGRLNPNPSRWAWALLGGIQRARRRFDGELAVEKYCKGRGIKVVHPEYLSFADQVRLFNTHDIFIGIEGSAFHTSLFRLSQERACHIYLCSADHEPRSANFGLIDSLAGNVSHKIDCAAELGPKHFSLDIRKAVDGISSHLPAHWKRISRIK